MIKYVIIGNYFNLPTPKASEVVFDSRLKKCKNVSMI